MGRGTESFGLMYLSLPNVSTKEEGIYESQRASMVRIQLMVRGIKDPRLLKAFKKVRRDLFVPEDLQTQAYEDNPLPIGFNQTISQPYVVAYMTEQLDLKGTERVLEVGTGSGYQAAILGELAGEVFSLEIVCELAERSAVLLKRLEYLNVHTRCGDGYRGWSEEAPFDRIILTAAPDHIPQPLLEQLKMGGKLIVPVGNWDQRLVLITKTPGGYNKTNLFPVSFVPMTGEARSKKVR